MTAVHTIDCDLIKTVIQHSVTTDIGYLADDFYCNSKVHFLDENGVELINRYLVVNTHH